MSEIWKKNCPDCGIEMIYSSKSSLTLSIKRNCLCRKCCRLGEKNPSFGKMNYWKGKIGPNKGKIVSDDFRLLMSKIVTGRKHKSESIEKMSLIQIGKNSWSKGRKVTDYTKYKLRMRKIEELRKKGIEPGKHNYNPKACEFIDKLNKEKGWNLQHALNGGEIDICGYFLDGYDKEKNIVAEYDEKYHQQKTQLEKDIIRQKRIIEKIHPKMFIRYNEKKNELIEIISGRRIS
jgi:hypothetical protein